MHDGEVNIDARTVLRMIQDQFPELGDLPVRRLDSIGTVNTIFRLGEDFSVRLPRLSQWEASLLREWEWLPRLAEHLTVSVPQPVHLGDSTTDYPFHWAVYRWIPGDVYSPDRVEDEVRAAEDLGRFVLEMRSIPEVDGAPPGGRRPLGELDEVTRGAIMSVSGVIPVQPLLSSWEEALEARAWDGAAVLLHGDLLPPNLLVRDNRLSGVLDFGGVGIGDPSADVVPAWSVFGPTGRKRLLEVVRVEEEVRLRARGYALHQAVMIVPYYARTNRQFVAMALRTIDQLLMDD